MSVKRIDRTVQMMRELQKETADALEAAALKLQAISKESVSRKHIKRLRQRKTDGDREKDRAFERNQVREFYLNTKPKN